MFGNCGVLQGISQGKGFVDMSTVDVDSISDIAEVFIITIATFDNLTGSLFRMQKYRHFYNVFQHKLRL